jgi:hypothetical protein
MSESRQKRGVGVVIFRSRGLPQHARNLLEVLGLSHCSRLHPLQEDLSFASTKDSDVTMPRRWQTCDVPSERIRQGDTAHVLVLNLYEDIQYIRTALVLRSLDKNRSCSTSRPSLSPHNDRNNTLAPHPHARPSTPTAIVQSSLVLYSYSTAPCHPLQATTATLALHTLRTPQRRPTPPP